MSFTCKQTKFENASSSKIVNYMPHPYFTSKHNLARLLANADYHPLAREFPAEMTHYDDIEATFDQLKSELNTMTNYNPDLLTIFGTKNAWICKPGSSCCGKGIDIIRSKRKILNYIIENPGVFLKFIKNRIFVSSKYISIRLATHRVHPSYNILLSNWSRKTLM